MSKKAEKIISINMERATAYDAVAQKEHNYVGLRIAEARKAKKLSGPQLCSLLVNYGVEITSTGLNKWELGRAVPNAYQLFAVAHALGIEEDMLSFIGGRAELNTEGHRKLAEYKSDLIATGRYKPIAPVQMMHYIEMKIGNLPVSAGPGEFLDEGGFQWLRFPENVVPSGASYGLRVSGDSMEPVYHDGQIVWVRECEVLRPGEVGVFVYDNSGYIKLYNEQQPEDGVVEYFTDSYGTVSPQPVLISYNEKYDPIIVSPHTVFRVVGKVLS